MSNVSFPSASFVFPCASPLSVASTVQIPKQFCDELFEGLVLDSDPIQSSATLREERREVLRRLKSPETGYLELSQWVEKAKLIEISDSELYALKHQNWKDPVFEKGNFQDLILIAFVRGYIDRMQLSDLLVFNACRLENAKIGSFQDPNDVADLRTSMSSDATCEEWDRFISAVQTLPLEQQRFYIRSVNRQDKNVLTRILGLGRTFLTLEKEGQTFQLVLSPTVLNEFYKAKSGSEACLINPVLGSSVALKNFKKVDCRDVLIPCSLFPAITPKVADGQLAPPLEFYHHDVAYHLLIENFVPRAHRQAYTSIANLFEGLETEVAVPFLDREFNSYVRLAKANEKEHFYSLIFWSVLRSKFEKVPVNNVLCDPEFYLEMLIKHIVENEEVWLEKYQIRASDCTEIIGCDYEQIKLKSWDDFKENYQRRFFLRSLIDCDLLFNEKLNSPENLPLHKFTQTLGGI